MWGQGSQRSHFSDLGVRELCARPSRPNRAQTPSLTEAVGPELTTPKTPGSILLLSPHLPHPLPSPNPSHLRLCQPLGSYPGYPLGGLGPSSPRPASPDSPPVSGPPSSTLGRRWESSEAEARCLGRPVLLQPRGQQGKEKRAEHFMAIINQRGKSSRRNKKLPYPGHRDLPGSSPWCPAAFPPPSCLPGQGPDLVPSPQAWAFHLPRPLPMDIQPP